MSVWGSQGLVVKEMVVGEHQQLVMVWVQLQVKVGFHLLPPYTAAGGDWVVRMLVTHGIVPEMVELGGNTPGLSQGWSTG